MRPPKAKEWERFLKNTARVRFWVDHSYQVEYRLSEQAVHDIASTRTALFIFPNVRRIAVGSSNLEPFIMCGNIEGLQLMFMATEFPGIKIPPALESIEERLCGLHELAITYQSTNVPAFDEELAKLLRVLSNLRHLTLPLGCLDASLARIVSQHQHLNTLECDADPPLIRYPTEPEARLLYVANLPPLQEGAFPKLNTFAVSAPNLSDAALFLTQPGFPSRNLTKIWFHTEVIPTSTELNRILDDLIPVYPQLAALTLAFHRLLYVEEGVDVSLRGIPTLKINDILPITRFACLETFDISHPYPIEMDDTDMKALRSPHLKKLLLNPHPIVPKPTNLTLNAYTDLLLNCANLREVGLFVDATRPAPPPFLPRYFGSLLTGVYFGRSLLSLASDATSTVYPSIARFLASVLPSSCTWRWPGHADEFTAELQYRDDWLPGLTAYHQFEEFEQGWQTVEAMVRLIEEERRGNEDREKEIRRLRGEIAKLKGGERSG